MASVITRDGTEIFYKDWGAGQPVVFSHGWPLTADAWDDQAFLVASHGYRAVAHDRRPADLHQGLTVNMPGGVDAARERNQRHDRSTEDHPGTRRVGRRLVLERRHRAAASQRL
jgi:pimeloyl-ACP methyl ester carboxylesterase